MVCHVQQIYCCDAMDLSSWGRLCCLAVPDGILSKVCVEGSHGDQIFILQTQQYPESWKLKVKFLLSESLRKEQR